MSVPDLVFDTPLWLGLVTVGIASLEGAVIGRESRDPRYDVVGAFVLATVLGLAGGILRDVLIGNLPVMAIRTPWYIATVAGVTVAVIVGGRYVPPLSGMWFVVLDALTLGLYTAIGTGYALQAGLPVVGALFVGVAAGVVGGDPRGPPARRDPCRAGAGRLLCGHRPRRCVPLCGNRADRTVHRRTRVRRAGGRAAHRRRAVATGHHALAAAARRRSRRPLT